MSNEAATVAVAQPIPSQPPAKVSGIRELFNFVITEDVAEPWRYHWSPKRETSLGICGAASMPTNLDAKQWGGSHEALRLQWCKECAKIKQTILPY